MKQKRQNWKEPRRITKPMLATILNRTIGNDYECISNYMNRKGIVSIHQYYRYRAKDENIFQTVVFGTLYEMRIHENLSNVDLYRIASRFLTDCLKKG